MSLCGDEKKYFYSYRDFEEEVKIPKFESDFILDKNKWFFFFRIEDLNKVIKFPYNKPKNISGQATLHVVHTPTRSNFWHFSLNWLDSEGKFIRRNESAWKYTLISSIKAALSEKLLLSLPEINPISESLYFK